MEIGTCSKLKFSICTIVGNKRAELRIIAWRNSTQYVNTFNFCQKNLLMLKLLQLRPVLEGLNQFAIIQWGTSI